MNENPYSGLVAERRFFTLLMVAGALLLGVGLTLLIVNARTIVYVNTQTTQSPGPVLAVPPPTTEASMPATSDPNAPPATTPQPAVVSLQMSDFTAACRHPSQYGDPAATAEIVRNSDEPPSYWVKCFHGDQMLGGLDLNRYCAAINTGTWSDNPKRYDYTATNDGWLYWACVPAS